MTKPRTPQKPPDSKVLPETADAMRKLAEMRKIRDDKRRLQHGISTQKIA